MLSSNFLAAPRSRVIELARGNFRAFGSAPPALTSIHVTREPNLTKISSSQRDPTVYLNMPQSQSKFEI